MKRLKRAIRRWLEIDNKPTAPGGVHPIMLSATTHKLMEEKTDARIRLWVAEAVRPGGILHDGPRVWNCGPHNPRSVP